MQSPGNTIEPLLNGELAKILRERGFETAALAEQRIRDSVGNSHKIDVLVDLDDRAIAIESEFSPARTRNADCKKRLPAEPLQWRGVAVESVFAVIYPQDLQRMDEARARRELRTCTLNFQEFTRDTDGAIKIGVLETGNILALAETLHNFWVRHDGRTSVDDAVNEASRAIDQAAEVLHRLPYVVTEADKSTCAAMALVWLNALLFQELLAANLDPASLPEEHKGKQITRPLQADSPDEILDKWREILEINWWPIFEIARNTLESTPSPHDRRALDILKRAAHSIASRGEIRRHDIAGRIYHRLLNARKFLATNYTTIPAAVLLAALAFDPKHPRWKSVRWDDPNSVRKLNIVDPACGTGTLLMAALQEILRSHRRALSVDAGAASTREVVRLALEEVLQGYDVVPNAVHLTAATLSMAETSQVIKDIQTFLMPHDMKDGNARLGSLDFIRTWLGQGLAQATPLFGQPRDPIRRSGTGEVDRVVNLPSVIDLVIANPPYTRAGGPGGSDNTDWNPIFGSVLSQADTDAMQKALRKLLEGTPASTYAGLGSAFVVLADQRLGVNGRLAFVLPATLATGSRWEPIRKMLLENYDVDWVVSSHDIRSRHHAGASPGRLWVSFSESTRMAEVLIVATKRLPGTLAEGLTRFVNLRRNVDDPIAAMAVARILLAQSADGSPREVATGEIVWGEVVAVPQAQLNSALWPQIAFVQGRLANTALALAQDGIFKLGTTTIEIPIRHLGEVCDFGPYHMQIKSPKSGLFSIVETDDPTRAGHPALWHHKSKVLTSLETAANARLNSRPEMSEEAQTRMLAQSGRLHLASELRHAPQRLAAVITDEPMLGVRSWITLVPKPPRPGADEALCLWLNSTPGLLLRIAYANRPYLGRSGLPHEKAAVLPVLDVDQLSDQQLQSAVTVFNELKSQTVQGFASLASDPVRRLIDSRLATGILGAKDATVFDALAKSLNHEPTMTARH